MLPISDYKAKLYDIITTVSKIIHMEIAVFDVSAQIICATPTYKRVKGTSVHRPSIREVFEKGNVVVTTPGRMESCVGCRFVDNCPSTVEILASVVVDSIEPCVVSITSFDKDDETIIKNIKYYIESLELVTQLIGTYLHNLVVEQENGIIRQSYLTQTRDSYLIVDQVGKVITHNLDASNCDLSVSNQLAFWVGDDVKDTIVRSSTSMTFGASILGEDRLITTTPISYQGKVLGYRISLNNQQPDWAGLSSASAFKSLISVSDCMNQLKETMSQIAKSNSSVVIYGETGTGKELVARSIHQLSPRKNEKFIAVNCANFPEQLFESELFGYEDGTFTGAKKGGKLGIFEQANGGTVFLDEISELPLFQQTKLLRFIQERTVTRLGGALSYPVDVRIICSTNKDLQKEMELGTFRKDLYYRINVIKLRVPSLRERREDIPFLVDHFVKLYKPHINHRIHGVSPEVADMLQTYDWPGNVRELENAIECSLNIELSDLIQPESLPYEIRRGHQTASQSVIKSNEATLIKQYLDANGWHKQGKERTAELLNISLRTLYRKIKELQLTQTAS